MNSVRNMLSYRTEPFVIEQYNHIDLEGNLINYSYDFAMNGIAVFQERRRKHCSAIFRVYPKGQNPMSKLREELGIKKVNISGYDFNVVNIESFGESIRLIPGFVDINKNQY